MKFVILLALTSVAICKHINQNRAKTSSLDGDIQDFIDLLPRDEIFQVIQLHLDDPELLDFITYVFVGDFKNVVLQAESIKELQQMADFCDRAGLGVYKWIGWFHNLIGIPPVNPEVKTYSNAGGFNGLLEDIRAILPKEDLRALFRIKLETRPDFKELFEKFGSAEFQGLIHSLYKNPRYQGLLVRLNDDGIDMDIVLLFLSDLFGWN